GAGMAATYHDDVVVGRVVHQTDLRVQKVTKRVDMVAPPTPRQAQSFRGTICACINQHFPGQTLRDLRAPRSN
ncbi:MAG: hypothetical protein ABI343_05120, partial [Burkholderiaceae bacterium]